MTHFYVVVSLATTCDEHSSYIARDAREIVQIAWSIVSASSLAEVRPEVLIVMEFMESNIFF